MFVFFCSIFFYRGESYPTFNNNKENNVPQNKKKKKKKKKTIRQKRKSSVVFYKGVNALASLVMASAKTITPPTHLCR